MFNFYDYGQGVGANYGCPVNCLHNCQYAKQWMPIQYNNPMMGACNQYITPLSNNNPYINQGSAWMPGNRTITFKTVSIEDIVD